MRRVQATMSGTYLQCLPFSWSSSAQVLADDVSSAVVLHNDSACTRWALRCMLSHVSRRHIVGHSLSLCVPLSTLSPWMSVPNAEACVEVNGSFVLQSSVALPAAPIFYNYSTSATCSVASLGVRTGCSVLLLVGKRGGTGREWYVRKRVRGRAREKARERESKRLIECVCLSEFARVCSLSRTCQPACR